MNIIINSFSRVKVKFADYLEGKKIFREIRYNTFIMCCAFDCFALLNAFYYVHKKLLESFCVRNFFYFQLVIVNDIFFIDYKR